MTDHTATIREDCEWLNNHGYEHIGGSILAAVESLQARLSTLEEALREADEFICTLRATHTPGMRVGNQEFERQQTRIHLKARAALAALPTDPNTRAWLGIEPQFPEEET